MAQLTVNPNDLRFTQDSIAIKFRSPYDHVRIDDAVDQIQAGRLTPNEFTTMNVVEHNGVLWCLDNRRLWVFRKARVRQVTVNIVPSDYSERSEMFFMDLNAELERQYSSIDFYPRVRGKLRSNFNPRAPSRISSSGSPAPLHPASSTSSGVPKSILDRQSSSVKPVAVHEANNTSRRVPKSIFGRQSSSTEPAAPLASLHPANNTFPTVPKSILDRQSSSAGPASSLQTSNPSWKTHIPSCSSLDSSESHGVSSEPVRATTRDPNSANNVDSCCIL